MIFYPTAIYVKLRAVVGGCKVVSSIANKE
jgi:hypothetical protein